VLPFSAGFAPTLGAELDFPFVIFGTAGTEDFNYLELRRLDRTVVSPHRVRIFQGEHTWPPVELTREALAWMEVQAMRAGKRPRDEAMIDQMFADRKAELEAKTERAEIYFATLAMAADFEGLRDVSAYANRAEAMTKDEHVVDAVRQMVLEDMDENELYGEVYRLSQQLNNEAKRDESMARLDGILRKIGAAAHADEDTPERRLARRVVYTAIAANAGGKDEAYRKLLAEIKP
jgi:hypothetical protein